MQMLQIPEKHLKTPDNEKTDRKGSRNDTARRLFHLPTILCFRSAVLRTSAYMEQLTHPGV
jgi:hypothetical protein